MSFPQQFMGEATDWQYDFPGAYVPDNTPAQLQQQPGYGQYIETGDIPSSTVNYMPMGSVPQTPAVARFHVPTTPASSLRRGYAVAQQQPLLSDPDAERHTKRIKRTRTVGIRP